MAVPDDVKQQIRERFKAGELPEAIAESLGYTDGSNGLPPKIAVHGICQQVRMDRKEIERGGPAKVVETTRREYLESGDAGASGGSMAAAAGVSASPMFPPQANNPVARIEVERTLAMPRNAGLGLLPQDFPPESSWADVEAVCGGGSYRATAYSHSGKALRVLTKSIMGPSRPPSDGQPGTAPFFLDPTGGELAEMRKEMREVMRMQLVDTKTRYEEQAKLERERLDRERELERERLRDERERQREFIALMDKQQKDFLLQMAQLNARDRDDDKGGGFTETLEQIAIVKKLFGDGNGDILRDIVNNKEWSQSIRELASAAAASVKGFKPSQAAAPAAAAQQLPAAAQQQAAQPDQQAMGDLIYNQLLAQGMTPEQAIQTVNELFQHAQARIIQAVQLNTAEQQQPQQAPPTNGTNGTNGTAQSPPAQQAPKPAQDGSATPQAA